MKLFRLAAVVSMLLLATASAFAQGMLTGAHTGTVTTDGAPLPGATITVFAPEQHDLAERPLRRI